MYALPSLPGIAPRVPPKGLVQQATHGISCPALHLADSSVTICTFLFLGNYRCVFLMLSNLAPVRGALRLVYSIFHVPLHTTNNVGPRARKFIKLSSETVQQCSEDCIEDTTHMDFSPQFSFVAEYSNCILGSRDCAYMLDLSTLPRVYSVPELRAPSILTNLAAVRSCGCIANEFDCA